MSKLVAEEYSPSAGPMMIVALDICKLRLHLFGWWNGFWKWLIKLESCGGMGSSSSAPICGTQ